MDMRIGIIGVGMVGGALARYYEGKGKPLLLYDKEKNMGSLEEIMRADVMFVCVPTPYEEKKGFDISLVEDVCGSIAGEKIIVIKSTILPGSTEYLQEK